MKSQFGEWLDLTLSNMGITNREAAVKLEVSEAAVSRWKSGKTKPGFSNVQALANLFDVDPMRLAATAGLTKDESIAPLPMPQATARQERIRKQILNIKYATDEERQGLVEYFETRERLRTLKALESRGEDEAPRET